MTERRGNETEALPRDLRARLEAAVRDADNPVAAVRAVRRVAAGFPARYRGQRDAVRWSAELALRPFFRELTGNQAAKAAVWAALDGIWDDPDKLDNHSHNRATRSSEATARLEDAARRLREAMLP